MTADRQMAGSKGRVILNILLTAGSIGAWLVMVFAGGDLFTATGLRSLKYFTVLSNIFEGIACIVWLAAVFSGGDRARLETAERLKYMAAVSVSLTFLTVMTFLGPLYGYLAMFVGVNLFLHLLVPLGAIFECIVVARYKYSRRDNLFAVIPMLIYGVFYLGNIIINGTGEWPDTNDWYGFLNWGFPAGLLIFAVLSLITWLAGAFIRRTSNYYYRKASTQGSGE